MAKLYLLKGDKYTREEDKAIEAKLRGEPVYVVEYDSTKEFRIHISTSEH